MLQKVQVAPSLIAGRGLFAKQDIKKGELIFIVQGPTIKYATLPYYSVSEHGLNVGPNSWKIPYRGSDWRYINHSCQPNAGLGNGARVVAMKNIKADEEVTIDYSCTESAATWHMNCNCGKTHCRKIIRSIQFLPKPLFKKYGNYISTFLKKAYESGNIYKKGRGRETGIFARDPIKKNAVLFTVEGPIIKYPKDPNYNMGWSWLTIKKNTWIIPLRHNPWWSMRHSCNPNTGLKGSRTVVAMRDINPNEEITLDSSITELDLSWKLTCHCGAKNCRKVIRSIQYLPAATYKKYRPYIPKFLQKAYHDYNSHRTSPIA